MTLKNRYWASLALVITGTLFFVCGALLDSPFWMWTLGLLNIAAGLVSGRRFHRCSHCGEHLDRAAPWRDSFCPCCGGLIDWNEKQSWRK